MEVSDKKVTKITILSSGQKSTKSVETWHIKVKQKALEEVVVDHYSLNQPQGVRHISEPSLPDQPSALANSDLVIIALGAEAICPLPSVLLQQAKDHQLPLVVLLAGGSRHTMSDFQIPEEQVSVIKTDMPVDDALAKLLQPFVSQGLVGIDVSDFRLIAPAGSRGFMTSAVAEGGEYAPDDAARTALISCQKAMPEHCDNVNLMASMVGHIDTFTLGDYSMVGDVVSEFSSSAATVICCSDVSETMPEDAFEVTVLMMEEQVAFRKNQPLH